jgi:DNA invertase Pin-like site-specific DNA recombinase
MPIDPQSGSVVPDFLTEGYRRRSRHPPPAPASRTLGYARVSTDEQATGGQSLAVQEQQLQGWAQMTNRRLDRVVVEAGVSGGVPFAERPQGGKLWADLKFGDSLVVAKLDRFSRNLFDCLQVSQELQKRGVSLYLLDVGAADPVTGNGQSKLFLSMLGAFAEFEKDRIGERIRATKQRQKAKGEYSGGTPPYGWRYDGEPGDKRRKLVQVPEEQRQIRRVLKLHDRGLSAYKIVADLRDSGLEMSHMTVRKIIARGGGSG